MRSYYAYQYNNLKYNLNTQNKIDSINGVLKKVYVSDQTLFNDKIVVKTFIRDIVTEINGLTFQFRFQSFPNLELQATSPIVQTEYTATITGDRKRDGPMTTEKHYSISRSPDGHIGWLPNYNITPPSEAHFQSHPTGPVKYIEPNDVALAFCERNLGEYWINIKNKGLKTFLCDLIVITSVQVEITGVSAFGYQIHNNYYTLDNDEIQLEIIAGLAATDDIPYNVTIGLAVGRKGNDEMTVIDYKDLTVEEKKRLNSPFTMPSNEFITTTTTVAGESWVDHMAKRIIKKRYRGLYTVSVDIPITNINDRVELYDELLFYDIFGKPIKRFGQEVHFEALKIEYREEGGGLIQRIEGLEMSPDEWGR